MATDVLNFVQKEIRTHRISRGRIAYKIAILQSSSPKEAAQLLRNEGYHPNARRLQKRWNKVRDQNEPEGREELNFDSDL